MTTPSREQIEKWAREAIVFADTKRDWRKDGSWSEAFNEHFSHLAYNAGRAAALEEAKAVCEGRAKKHKTSSFKQARLVAAECTDCANAIDALAAKETQP